MTDERQPIANITPFGLRMQPDLKARLEDEAKRHNRSLNSEIVERLANSLARDEVRAETVIRELLHVLQNNADDADRRFVELHALEYLAGVPTNAIFNIKAYAQFMKDQPPGSLDERLDERLLDTAFSAARSVALFLKEFGWTVGEPPWDFPDK